jgi:hypothetical protein
MRREGGSVVCLWTHGVGLAGRSSGNSHGFKRGYCPPPLLVQSPCMEHEVTGYAS